MRGFWSGMVTGGVIFAAMSIYMNMGKKRNRSIIGQRSRQANQVIQGVSKTVKALIR